MCSIPADGAEIPQNVKHFKYTDILWRRKKNRSTKLQRLSSSTKLTLLIYLFCSSESTDQRKRRWDNWWKYCWFATVCTSGWCVPYRCTAASTSGQTSQELEYGRGEWKNVLHLMESSSLKSCSGVVSP